MEEKVKALVLQLQDIVRKQTKEKYPDVNNAVKSLQDYVQERTASKSGVEDKLKELEDILSKKSEKKKSCTDLIEKIRKAMCLQINAATRGTKSKEEKRKQPSSATSERTSSLTSKSKQTKMSSFSIRASPAPDQRVSHLQGQKINVQPSSNRASPAPVERVSQLQGQIPYVHPSGYELTQTDETTELSGIIEEKEEDYQDEMVDEVRFFMECLNGLKKVFSDDTKNPLEKIIPVPKGKIKKKVKTGHRFIMDVAEDISRLKTENQHLKKTLDGLHKYIIGGDETALNELKPPKHMKDNQSIVEVEANVKQVKQKFHETKTNAENATEEIEYLLSIMECLINHVRGLSEGNTEGDISSALDQIKSSVKKGSPANQFLTHAKEIIGIQMEWKREAEYASHLIEELNERLAYDGKQDTQISLKGPPIQMARASSKNEKKNHKKQNGEKPCTRHIEQLQRNFASASNVLTKLMFADESIAERECLLSTLECLCNYVRDLSEGKTEGETWPPWDEIRSSIKKESSVNQGLSNAKEIARYQMEWKREAEYASHLIEELNERLAYDGKQDTQISLKGPPIQMAHASSKDGKKDHKRPNDEKPCTRHIEQLQRNFASASNVLTKLMFADESIAERECLLSTLECLCNYVRDLSEGKTEGETSPPWDEIRSSIKKESSVNQGLSNAKEIARYQMEWKRNAENATEEIECLLSTMKCLINHVRGLSEGNTEGDISSALDQIKSSVKKGSPAKQFLTQAKEIIGIQMEWKREFEYMACLLKELANVSQSTSNGDNSISLSHPENIGTLRDYKTNDAKNTETSRNNPMQSVQKQKLAKHYANAAHVLKQMKEKENLRIDLVKKTTQVEELRVRLQKMQDENNEIKKEADSLRTRLSEHAGALLTHNNPSISDLSDPNRPTKLSEMYSELYDNQWTDAFANIAKKDPDISDNTIIGYLYEMLVDGYRFCEDVRQTQISSLEDILFYPAVGMNTSQRRQKEEISTIFANHLSDVAKLSSNKSSAHVAKAFVMDEKTKDKYRKMIKLCERYIQECVQLCWLMQVQTPPLCLDLKTIQGQTFDKNCYREYTKKGKKIAFVVWPALFLHDNGPVLSKGVAQCE